MRDIPLVITSDLRESSSYALDKQYREMLGW